MVPQIRIGDVDQQAFTRLAANARADGIRLYRDHDGRYYATSVRHAALRLIAFARNQAFLSGRPSRVSARFGLPR